MKLVVAAAALVSLASPVWAQDAHAGHSGHVDSAKPAPAAASRLNLDTPIETIAADTQGKAVLDADLPGLTTHEHYQYFKAMSLRKVSEMAPDRLPAEALAKIETDLAAIK